MVLCLTQDWRHLCIDVQYQTCSPQYFKDSIAAGIQFAPGALDHTPNLHALACDIAEFTQQTRKKLRPVWVNYFVPELAIDPETKDRFCNQEDAYIIERRPGELALQKSRTSAVPENLKTFHMIRAQGVPGFVTTGLNADACVLETVQELMNMGFKIVAPQDLLQSTTPERKQEGIEMLRNAGAIITDSSSVMRALDEYTP